MSACVYGTHVRQRITIMGNDAGQFFVQLYLFLCLVTKLVLATYKFSVVGA